MQLNNTNGKSIKLDKIDILQNRIVYSIYEYGTSTNKTQLSYVFKTMNLKDYLTQTVNFEELCYTNLIAEKETVLLNEHIHSGSNLDTLIKLMRPLISFKQVLEQGSMQYLVTLEDTARTILENYGIVIEDKI